MQNKTKPLWLSCLLSQLIWCGGLLLLLLLCTAIANGAENPGILYIPLSLTCLYLSALFSGVGVVRLSGGGWETGLLSGTISAVLVFAVTCLPLFPSGFDFPVNLLLRLAVIPAACAGAFIGQKRRNTRKKKNFRRKR